MADNGRSIVWPSSDTPKVFLLVNHVSHRRVDESESEFSAKVTDSRVVAAVARWVQDRTSPDARITIGNSPLQSCDYSALLRDVRLEEALRESFAESLPSVQDLRGRITSWNRAGVKLADRILDPDDWVEVDLGADSLLEELYADGREPKFRVGDYEPEETERFHARGRHVYVVHRQVLSADLLVSIPKLKTHQKVGATLSIKGTVGAISRKECLAHHQLGSPKTGGDECSTDNRFARAASSLNEFAARGGMGFSANVVRVLSKVAYRAARWLPGTQMGGAWHGNDTAWRMAVDIARVLRFADAEGRLHDSPVREHLVVIDALIAGEGEGPLRPTPRRMDRLIVANDPLAADVAGVMAMGWAPDQLELIARAVDLQRFPISNARDLSGLDCILLDEVTPGQPASREQRAFVPPAGWSGHV